MAKRKAKTIYLTPEPKWKELQDADPEVHEKIFRDCDYFARTEISDKAKNLIFRKWVKTKSGWADEEIEVILRNPDWAWSTSATAAYLESKLGWMPEAMRNFIDKKKSEWHDRGLDILVEKEEKAKEKPKVVISIQDRMKEQVSELCGEWDGYLDELVCGEKAVKDFEPYNEMRSYAGGVVKPAHAKIIKDMYNAEYVEALLVVEWKDDDIKEAYSNLDVKARKALLAFFEKINTACDTFIETGKATRKKRQPKAVSREKMVSKLKYQLNDSTLGLASVAPTEIIDATEVWVYNTKTRKIGVYKVEALKSGMTVKGTSIQDYDINSSVQKTIRKPVEVLKQFKGNAKTKYNKAFVELTTTDTKLTGRLNDQTIILKTF
jgi:hypothetical protein|tara:strand:- start:23267 stop:24400 length:1134 start_codon:yes stop_codon:yes gene_type:complete